MMNRKTTSVILGAILLVVGSVALTIWSDELKQIAGKRDLLVGQIQTKYGIAHEAADGNFCINSSEHLGCL